MMETLVEIQLLVVVILGNKFSPISFSTMPPKGPSTISGVTNDGVIPASKRSDGTIRAAIKV
jgi:hypothetical protein